MPDILYVCIHFRRVFYDRTLYFPLSVACITTVILCFLLFVCDLCRFFKLSHFYVSHFPSLRYCAAFSFLVFSCLAKLYILFSAFSLYFRLCRIFSFHVQHFQSPPPRLLLLKSGGSICANIVGHIRSIVFLSFM